MTDRELRRLRRSDLLEMLIETEKKCEELRGENQVLKKQVEEREIKISKAGSIAEAALQLNGVFEAAQAAAAQYLENIQGVEEKQEENSARIMTEAKTQAEVVKTEAETILLQARNEAELTLKQANQDAEAILTKAKQDAEDLKGKARRELKGLMDLIGTNMQELVHDEHEKVREAHE